MALKRELIQFNIVNQTDCVFNLSLFQQNVYSVNATTKYSYDVTTVDLSCGTGTIVVNGNTLNLSFSPDLTSFLAALNGLGFGFFCSQTDGGNTYVYTVDDTNVYGDMDICPVVGTTTTTTTTTVAPPETTTTTTTTTVAPPETTTTTTTTTVEPPPETTTTTTTTTVPETTTTTTTTTVPETTTTTTTTTLACDNVEFIEIEVSVGGTINYIDCYQTPRTQTVGAGTEFVGLGNGVLVSSLTGDAVYTITSYGTCCLAETTTTTTTTTVTPPPALTFSSASAGDACTSGIGMTNIVYGGGTGLCDSTTVQCDEFLPQIAGVTIWISDGSNVREAVINDPNVSGIATFVGACSVCGATTTTTTTTVPETTTTTTTTTVEPVSCTEYFNNTGVDANGVNYTDCNGTVFTNQTIGSNQSICVQDGTLFGGDSGFLTNLGSCTPPTP